MPSSTPIYGFPYPLGTDPVGQGAQDIEDLATAVENYLDIYQGLVKIVPSSVSGTGATIASNGDVVVSGGTSSFVINGAFPTQFLNFKILVTNFIASTATGVYFRLGTVVDSSYKYAGIYVNTSGTVTGYGNAAQQFFDAPIVWRSGHSASGEVTIQQPNVSKYTTFYATGSDTDNGSMYRASNGVHLVNTAYTTLTMLAGANFTAITVSIYGYNQ